MEKFNFRFDTILSAKEKIEDDKKNKFGLSMKKLSLEQEHLENLFKKKSDIINHWQEKSQAVIKIGELRNLSNNLDLIQGIINKQISVVDEKRLEAENRRKELLEASKQKKVFEKLK